MNFTCLKICDNLEMQNGIFNRRLYACFQNNSFNKKYDGNLPEYDVIFVVIRVGVRNIS